MDARLLTTGPDGKNWLGPLNLKRPLNVFSLHQLYKNVSAGQSHWKSPGVSTHWPDVREITQGILICVKVAENKPD